MKFINVYKFTFVRVTCRMINIFYVAGPILLFLPETKNKDLPDSLENAENLWKKCNVKSLKTEMTKF